ncbi:prenyltransferase/squalene oxidase repeat-containing protein [Microtetraspora malaysiensis]|uniref:prenyltransferase/squalene oxidase repeat-containing protein n=1 Tax=Microtetraspora malaysiensis TaxID=161358 RepID=UPI003D89E47A
MTLPGAVEGVDIPAASEELLAGLMSRPWGAVSPSVYETGRLVSLAPWLTGHRERVDFLIAAQRPDGGWGAPDGYGLVPTLSAMEAVLCVLGRGDSDMDRAALTAVARRGLEALSRELAADVRARPDMPAIELIVPSLVGWINEHLDGMPEMLRAEWEDGVPLPPDMSHTRLELVRAMVRSGAELPEKLLHALEVAGDAASGAPAVAPTPIGTVGASPAATAAWLGDRGLLDPLDPARRHLEAVARRHGGPVPVGLPITVFERSWVLSLLARAGIPCDVPAEMIADLRAAIGPTGTPAGSGLPADADTTSVSLYALALLGMPYEPESLLAYETETHFCTWRGEQGRSFSVNAHVLDAFGQYALSRPLAAPRYRAATEKVTGWLLDGQRADGGWEDRWHASPYYATASCALALHDFGGDAAAPAVRRAVRWVLETQRPDGSWGRWSGTVEETAYAMQVLLCTREGAGEPDDEPVIEAAARGYRYLLEADGAEDGTALWLDKDLYRPDAIVRAAVLAARHLARAAGIEARSERDMRSPG